MALGDNPPKTVPRHELIALALELGVTNPDALTDAELSQCVQVLSEGAALPAPSPLGRSWFSVARHLVASVIEKGLNLPTAARVLRETVRSVPPQRPPYPTVTLAQIYIAQGHTQRAAATLQQVLRRDPANVKANRLLSELPPEVVAEPNSAQPLAPVPPVSVVQAESPDPPGETAQPEQTAQPKETAQQSAAAEPDAVADEAPAVPVDTAPVVAAPAHSVALSEAASSLPSRDALVIVRRGSVLTYYWELSEGTRAKAAPLQLCVTHVTAHEEGPSTRQTTLPLAQELSSFSEHCSPDVIVRAALGSMQSGGFRPVCVASSFSIQSDGTVTQEFCPRRGQDDRDVVRRASRFIS